MIALFKDALREIRRSFGRFMSIFIIIALGCGFFTGLKATCPDMILTASEYFEQNRLMDIRLRSNIGVKSDEIAAVRSADGVKGAGAGYSKDVFYSYDDQNVVLKAISINSNIGADSENNLNRPTLIEGRLPQKKNECAVEVKISSPDTFEIGNKLTLLSPSRDEDILDTFAYDTFEIVGIVVSPMYIGYERDPTSIGNGTVASNIFLPEEAFVCDYYTDLYIALDDIRSDDPFSQEYEDEVKKNGAAAEEAFRQSVNARYEKLKSDAQAAIESACGSADSLGEVLSCEPSQLQNLLSQAEDGIEKLQKRYDAMTEQDGARRYLIRGQLLQTKEKAQMLSDLIGDADGSVRAGYERQLEEAQEQIASAKARLDDTPELKIYSETRFASNDYSSYRDDAEKINNVSKAFPMFFVLIAALVCLTTMTRMVEEQRTSIGTYKALGYSSKHILMKYLLYGTTAAVLGSCIGSAIGLQVFPRMIIKTYRIMYNIPGELTPFRAGYMLAALAASVLLTWSAVIFTCIHELREQPAAIMRPKPPAGGKRVVLERIPAVWNRLGFLMKVTVRNLLRYKKRFFMTLVGVSGCTALIITGFGLKNSISEIVDKQFGGIYRYSAMAALNTDEDDPLGALEESEYVERYAPAQSFSVNAGNGSDSYSTTVIVTEESPDDFVALNDTDGEPLMFGSEDGVIVTEKLADMCSLDVGSQISVTDNNGDEYTARISGIMQNYALNYIYMSTAQYEEIFGREAEYNVAMLIADGSSDEQTVKSSLIADERILGVTFKSDTTKSFLNSVKSMNAIVLLLIICAAFLAVTVLYNLANINITERRRELATIKVLGFYDLETSAYIYRENIISTVIGIAIGMLMGRLLHYFVVITVEVDAVLFIRDLVWWAYLAGAMLTMLFALLVNIVLHFKLMRIDMAESLKSIE